jgi:ferritin-like metal-binding protein YciE
VVKSHSKGEGMQKVTSLEGLLHHELADLLSAEHIFMDGMKKMVKHAQSDELKQAITNHIQETEGQIETLKQVFRHMGKKAEEVTCKGAKGIASEYDGHIKEMDESMIDLFTVGGASRVEHYEIAAYQHAIELAKCLDNEEIVSLLQENLQQEQTTAQTMLDMVAVLGQQVSGMPDVGASKSSRRIAATR